jgi:GAF domain-containing protein
MQGDLTAALAAAVRNIGRAETTEAKLTAIVETLAISLPEFAHIGISTVDKSGEVQTQVATTQLVWELDALQYELGEGPCLDSMRGINHVEAPHIATDERWPRYVPSAVELGLKSQMAVKLYVDDEETIGGLNMYSVTSEDIDDGAVGIAGLFATQAAVALGQSRQLDQLHEALRTRQMIGQAVGLVMAEYSLSDDAAFEFLARTSSYANIKLRDVAARIISEHIRSSGASPGERPPRP